MNMSVILVICDLPVVIALAVTPFVTRKTELFGVSIPSKESPSLNGLRGIYTAIALVLGAIVTLASYNVIDEDPRSVLIWCAWLFGYMLAMFAAFLVFRSHMLKIKREKGWDTPYPGVPAAVYADLNTKGDGAISAAWNLIYIPIFLFTVMGLAVVWQYIPDPYPTHFNFAGEADAWAAKTIGSFAPLLILQAVLALIFIGCFFALKHTKRQYDAQNPERTAEQLRVFRKVMTAGLVFIGALTNAFMGSLQILTAIPEFASGNVLPYLLIPYLVLIAAVMVVMLLVGQGGSRVKTKRLDAVAAVNVNDDKHWLLGVIYFNPKDPSVFVEKRFGVGMTMNAGHPAGIAIWAATAVLLIGSVIWAIAALA